MSSKAIYEDVLGYGLAKGACLIVMLFIGIICCLHRGQPLLSTMATTFKKIVKPAGQTPDEFEERVATELWTLAVSGIIELETRTECRGHVPVLLWRLREIVECLIIFWVVICTVAL